MQWKLKLELRIFKIEQPHGLQIQLQFMEGYNLKRSTEEWYKP
jgi:hypothetical protein